MPEPKTSDYALDLALIADAAYAAVKGDLEAALGKIYGSKTFTIERVQNNPKERLTIAVKLDSPVAIAELCAVA